MKGIHLLSLFIFVFTFQNSFSEVANGSSASESEAAEQAESAPKGPQKGLDCRAALFSAHEEGMVGAPSNDDDVFTPLSLDKKTGTLRAQKLLEFRKSGEVTDKLELDINLKEGASRWQSGGHRVLIYSTWKQKATRAGKSGWRIVSRHMASSDEVFTPKMLSWAKEGKPNVFGNLNDWMVWKKVKNKAGDFTVDYLLKDETHAAMDLAAKRGVISIQDRYRVEYFCQLTHKE